MAALVSVSPPRATVATTPSSSPRRVQQLVERVLERDQHPALVRARRLARGRLRPHRAPRPRAPPPRPSAPSRGPHSQASARIAVADRVGHGHHERRRPRRRRPGAGASAPLSSRAQAAAVAAGSAWARTPSGLARMSEPFAWLSPMRYPLSAARVVLPDVERPAAVPLAVGGERRARLVAVLGDDRARQRQRHLASRRSAGPPACARSRRRPARAGPPDSAARIASAVWNSTRLPRLSPATWPSRQPCARERRRAVGHGPAALEPEPAGRRRRPRGAAPPPTGARPARARPSDGRANARARRLMPVGVVRRPPRRPRPPARRRRRAAARGPRRSPRRTARTARSAAAASPGRDQRQPVRDAGHAAEARGLRAAQVASPDRGRRRSRPAPRRARPAPRAATPRPAAPLRRSGPHPSAHANKSPSSSG